jgi:hypothetical protein
VASTADATNAVVAITDKKGNKITADALISYLIRVGGYFLHPLYIIKYNPKKRMKDNKTIEMIENNFALTGLRFL